MITESLEEPEEYEDIEEENETLPESLNIPGEMVSTQRSDYEDPTRLYSDDEGFQSWWSRQAELKENVRKVCIRYGQSLNSNVPLKEKCHKSFA